MPLEILAPMVVLGIILAVVLVQFSGLSQPASLVDEDQVRTILNADFPDAEIVEVILQENGKMAVASFNCGAIGTIDVMGAKFLTRKHAKGDIVSVNRSNEGVITIYFRDFTHPSGTFVGRNETELNHVETLFNRLLEA